MTRKKENSMNRPAKIKPYIYYIKNQLTLKINMPEKRFVGGGFSLDK
jgi:hypothetical protein